MEGRDIWSDVIWLPKPTLCVKGPCCPGGAWTAYPHLWEVGNKFLVFLCLSAMAFALPVKLSLFQSRSFLAFTLPILSLLLQMGEWASGCTGLGCYLGLNHGTIPVLSRNWNGIKQETCCDYSPPIPLCRLVESLLTCSVSAPASGLQASSPGSMSLGHLFHLPLLLRAAGVSGCAHSSPSLLLVDTSKSGQIWIVRRSPCTVFIFPNSDTRKALHETKQPFWWQWRECW